MIAGIMLIGAVALYWTTVGLLALEPIVKRHVSLTPLRKFDCVVGRGTPK
jgi:hypothetical protein